MSFRGSNATGTPLPLIFVIDDEQVIARTLAIILQRAGYSTEFFSSAEDALNAATLRRPNLVVSDVMLNGMNGIRCAHLMQNKYPALPFILMSGQAETARLIDEARERGQRVQVHAKPMHPESLLQEVARLLAESAAEAKAA